MAIKNPIHAAHPRAANHTGHHERGGEFPQGTSGSFQFGPRGSFSLGIFTDL